MPVTASQANPASEISMTVTEKLRPQVGRNCAGIERLMRGVCLFSAIAFENGIVALVAIGNPLALLTIVNKCSPVMTQSLKNLVNA